MSGNLKLLVAGVCLLAVAYKIQAADQRLHCWHCSSDTIGAEDFCGVTFQEASIPTDQLKERNLSVMRVCNSTINSEYERAVCRKTVEKLNGREVTKRFCYYANKSDPLAHCHHEPTEKNVQRVFCEDCLTDKCNSAPKAAGAALGVVVLPMLVARALVA